MLENVLQLKLTPTKSKRQLLMAKLAKEILGESPLENYYHPDLKFSATKMIGQLDAFFPNLMIAFEYQGEQHYRQTVYDTKLTQKRDKEKRSLCESKGVTLIEIPYWWDGTRASLEATIRSKRPDLILKDPLKEPISTVEPPYRTKSTYTSKILVLFLQSIDSNLC
jgi:hypothetical protein